MGNLPLPHGCGGIVLPKMMCLNALDTRIHSSWDELQKFMTQTSGGLPYDIDSKLAADPLMTMTHGRKSGRRTPR